MNKIRETLYAIPKYLKLNLETERLLRTDNKRLKIERLIDWCVRCSDEEGVGVLSEVECVKL